MRETRGATVTRPRPSSAQALRRMQRTRRSDTGPELAVRSLLHGAGLRYRVHFPPIPGIHRRADVVFVGTRLAIYVDGCFWHGCPLHATWPKANAEWWRVKLEQNRARDLDTDERLRARGWSVVRVWEHEDAAVAVERIIDMLAELRRAAADDKRKGPRGTPAS
jgi:DNA mismatch endonuclease, patch repair protein